MQRCLPEQRQRVLFPSPELAAGSAACPGDTQLSVPGASWKVDGNKLAGLPKQLWWRQQGRPTEPCSGRLLVPPRTSSWLCPQAHRRQLGHHSPRDHPGGVLGNGDVPRATLQPEAQESCSQTSLSLGTCLAAGDFCGFPWAASSLPLCFLPRALEATFRVWSRRSWRSPPT